MAEYAGFWTDGGVLRCSLVTGHATQSTLAGITTDDQIIFALHCTIDTNNITTFVDFTSSTSITEDGKIDWASDTALDGVWVWWWDVEPANTGTATPPLDVGYTAGYRYGFALVDGGAAAAELTCTGITTSSKLIHCLLMETKAAIATWTDDTANCSIPAAGKIASATATTNDQFFVVWLDPEPTGITDAESYSGPPRLKVDVVAGLDVETNIAVGGIETDDELLCVLEGTATASLETMADLTSETTITSDGNIQLATTDATSNTLIVIWHDLNA